MSTTSATRKFSIFYKNNLSHHEVVCKEPISNFSDIIKWLVIRKVETFYKSGKLQCRRGRSRSIEDICHCARHHLGFTPREVIIALAKVIMNPRASFHFFLCEDIEYYVASFMATCSGEYNLADLEDSLDTETDRDYPHRPGLAMEALIEQCKKLSLK